MLYERLKIEGFLPERGLLRLKRSGISLYQAKKTEKNTILFLVKRKDAEKVFAIYPNVCYNKDSNQNYCVRRLGGVGLARILDFLKNRMGMLLGGLAFCAVTLAADGLVLGVELTGSKVYAREVYKALAENGVKQYGFYPDGKADMVTARLLSLSGVEFCSVQKIGHSVCVEMRLSPFAQERKRESGLMAQSTGKIQSIAVLQGTALKKVGAEVQAGEPLVGGWFENADGKRVEVTPIARVQLLCEYEGNYAVEDGEKAFCEAYLALGLEENVRFLEKEVTPTEQGYAVRLVYTLTQTVNLP